jgi:hypothetical protein
MCGMKKHETGSDTKKDPDSRINKSLRKWNCKCSAEDAPENKTPMHVTAAGDKVPQPVFRRLDNEPEALPKKEDCEQKKEAVLGTTVGILGGALTGRKGKRVLAAGRGALKGLGWDLGSAPGAALGVGVGMLGGPVGMGLGGALGYGAGGMLGKGIVDTAIGPYESEDEMVERVLAERDARKENKEEKEAMSLIAFGAKIAASSCSYQDMPNGPTNKKHTTSASPAVLEADEKSEEIGKPETDETEHSESVITDKQAFAFGEKLGFDLDNLTGNAPPLSERAMNLPVGLPPYDPAAALNPRDVPATKSAPVVSSSRIPVPPKPFQANSGLPGNRPDWLPVPRKPIAPNALPPKAKEDRVQSGGPKRTLPRSSQPAANKPNPADLVNAAFGPVDAEAAASAGKGQANPGGGGGDKGGKGGIYDALMKYGPAGLALGLGGAGLYGLYNHMNQQPKKKRRDKEEDA